jgi:hypothetical protein
VKNAKVLYKAFKAKVDQVDNGLKRAVYGREYRDGMRPWQGYLVKVRETMTKEAMHIRENIRLAKDAANRIGNRHVAAELEFALNMFKSEPVGQCKDLTLRVLECHGGHNAWVDDDAAAWSEVEYVRARRAQRRARLPETIICGRSGGRQREKRAEPRAVGGRPPEPPPAAGEVALVAARFMWRTRPPELARTGGGEVHVAHAPPRARSHAAPRARFMWRTRPPELARTRPPELAPCGARAPQSSLARGPQSSLHVAHAPLRARSHAAPRARFMWRARLHTVAPN